jgi:predicted hydrocarbon binding protein
MFKEERDETMFDWSMLGDIKEGRPNLGHNMEVSVYRLMQFTLRDVLIKEFDVETADKIFYQAGKEAGHELYKNVITKKEDFNDFIIELQSVLKNLKIGILRIEKADLEKFNFTLTVAEDLDCSGLPITDEQICIYDEGFISGVLSEHTGKEFTAKEIDCWCSGDRVCRFEATLAK